MPRESPGFAEAVARFEAAHREDPAVLEGSALPVSLHYHRRLSHWVEVLDPSAAEPLRLAARCQHIRRFTIPREEFPRG